MTSTLSVLAEQTPPHPTPPKGRRWWTVAAGGLGLASAVMSIVQSDVAVVAVGVGAAAVLIGVRGVLSHGVRPEPRSERLQRRDRLLLILSVTGVVVGAISATLGASSMVRETSAPHLDPPSAATGRITSPTMASANGQKLRVKGTAINATEQCLWTLVRVVGPVGHPWYKDDGKYAWPRPVDLDPQTGEWNGWQSLGAADNPQHAGLQFEIDLICAPIAVAEQFQDSNKYGVPVYYGGVKDQLEILHTITVSRE